MAPITVSADVNRPAEVVFTYATDPTRFAEWQKGVARGHLDTGSDDRSPRVGDRCVMVRRIGFADRPSSSELVYYDPPRTWRVRGIHGRIRADVEVTVVPLPAERSRVMISVDFGGHGIGAVLIPLVVRRQARAEMPANITALKTRLEQQEN